MLREEKGSEQEDDYIKGVANVIKFNQKGDFKKLSHFLSDKKDIKIRGLEQYAAEGVKALSLATPVNSGETASSWSYEIKDDGETTTIEFHNSNIKNGFPVAIMLQYGHGTGTGGYVQGRDYINPVIRPLFDKIAENAWKEVTKK